MRHHTVVPPIVVVGAALVTLLSLPALADVAPTSNATIDLKPVVGSQSLAVSGTAPSGAEVRVTLYATLSRDIPDVTLSRTTIRSGAQGTYATTMPIAPAFVRGAVITAVASVLPSGRAASAHWTVVAPNVTVAPDNLPYQVR